MKDALAALDYIELAADTRTALNVNPPNDRTGMIINASLKHGLWLFDRCMVKICGVTN